MSKSYRYRYGGHVFTVYAGQTFPLARGGTATVTDVAVSNGTIRIQLDTGTTLVGTHEQ